MPNLNESTQKDREQQKLIDRIRESIDDNSELNDWEDSFLQDILKRVMDGWGLSAGQEDTLEKIEFVRAEGRDAYWEEYGNR